MSQDADMTGEAMAQGPAARLFRTNDGIGGLIAIGVGAVSVAEGMRLGLGTLSRMGPGYVPVAIGTAMIGLGALLIVNVLRRGAPLARVPFGLPAILVLVSLGAFGILLPLFGLVPAAIVLMLVATLAITGRIGLADIVYAVATSIVAVLVFINGLGVVLPIVRWPF